MGEVLLLTFFVHKIDYYVNYCHVTARHGGTLFRPI